MPEDSGRPFLEELRSSGVLDEEQLDEAKVRAASADSGTAAAAALVGDGLLTKYQAERILAGQGKSLAIGPYVVLEPIGAGGMGEVLKALDRQMDRTVAIKVIAQASRGDPKARARFLREVRATAKLNHPNIVTAHHVIDESDTTYLAMEYVAGRNLYQIIKRQGALPPQQAARIAYHVAEALEHARKRGIVHRDIKPSNILIGDEGVVKVTDMGLARIELDGGDGGDSAQLTAEGMVIGTLDYMAPEQARDTRSADIRADIYSLGCTLYHMLVGEVPFPSDSAPEKLLKHQTERPVPVTARVPGVPLALAEAVERMMAKRPGDRFQTPAEVAEALRPWSEAQAPPLDSDEVRRQALPPFSASELTALPTQVSDRRPSPIGTQADTQAPLPPTPPASPSLARSEGLSRPSDLSEALSGGIRPSEIRRRRATMLVVVGSLVVLVAVGIWLVPSRGPQPQENGEQFDPNRTYTNTIGMTFIYIPQGSFMMGSPEDEARGSKDDDERLHQRVIDVGFYMSVHEVTRKQFAAFVAAKEYVTGAERNRKAWIRLTSGHPPWQEKASADGEAGGYSWKNPNFEQADDHPVVCVTWRDATAFCDWLSATEGKTYRLPTEPEWEYACRAGTRTPFHTGPTITTNEANFYGLKGYPPGSAPVGEFRRGTTRVGAFGPNAWRLYDMHGNAWEWCQDPYQKDPSTDEEDLAAASQPKEEYVRRGGGWASSPVTCRSANRFKLPKDWARADSGFRVVLEGQP